MATSWTQHTWSIPRWPMSAMFAERMFFRRRPRSPTRRFGITINTSPIDFAPIKQVQLRRFKGERWELFGPTLSSEIGG
jgi:hypothetical protein